MKFTPSTKYALIAGTTFCIALVTLGILSYHTTNHCETKTSDLTTDECPSEVVELCKSHAPALGVHAISGTTENKISCSYRAPTSIFGLICLILSFLYMLIFAFMACGKPFKKEFIIVAGAVLLTSVIALALMIADVAKGSSYYRNNGKPGQYKPQSYIANIILMFFSGVMFAFMGWVGYKMEITPKIAENPVQEKDNVIENSATNREENTGYNLEITNRIENLDNDNNDNMESKYEMQPTERLENQFGKSIETINESQNQTDSKFNRFDSRFEGSLFDINLREKVVKAHLQSQASHYGFGPSNTKSEFTLTRFDTARSFFPQPKRENE